MTHTRRLLHRAVFRAVIAFSVTASALAAPEDGPPDFVPLGVYLSWERPGACAKHYGIDRWPMSAVGSTHSRRIT